VNRLKRFLTFESRRNHLQVLADILELCRTPQAKTYILRNTNTSFKLLEMYLLQLQTADLLEIHAQTRKFVTTKQGFRFIKGWSNLKAMLYPQEFPLTNKKGRCALGSNRLITVPNKAPTL
jgi:predicted transcriptional regulator